MAAAKASCKKKGQGGGATTDDEKQSYIEQYMEAGQRSANNLEPKKELARRLKLDIKTVRKACDRTRRLRKITGKKDSVASPPVVDLAWIPKPIEDLVAAHAALYAAHKLHLPQEKLVTIAGELIKGTEYCMQSGSRTAAAREADGGGGRVALKLDRFTVSRKQKQTAPKTIENIVTMTLNVLFNIHTRVLYI